MRRAIWFMETHLGDALDLELIANDSGLDRFRLARQFARATGTTVMRYVRDRRLAVAARRLADGETDILALALESGYGSHEAFTRAFSERFGVTPSAVRCAGSAESLPLQEPIAMLESAHTLAAPEIVEAPARRMLGLVVDYPDGPGAGIPGQWVRFNALPVPRGTRSEQEAWGVCEMVGDDRVLRYACAIETRPGIRVPGLEAFVLASARYAVFRHEGHVSDVHRSWSAIMDEWLPSAPWTIVDAPDLERYGPEFDPDTGDGGLELWVPVTERSG